MMLRLGLDEGAAADELEAAVDRVLAAGWRTGDLASDRSTALGCRAMGDRLLQALEATET
jgi:3-isopropylmalate dehydrogenase